MNILITGCNGQLGNEMQLLAKANPQHQYFLTDIIIPEGLKASVLDATKKEDVEKFVEENNIDCIVNCAAYTAVDKAESDKSLCEKINTDAPGILAEVIGKRGGSMIHVSTDYVFDGTNHTPYKEEQATCPNSVYGITKLAGEKKVQAGCKNSMIIRTAWLYSIYGNNFVKTMIRLGKEKSELGVIFDQIGTPTYARDLAVAIMTAINKGIVPGIYHFSNEGVISWYDFTKAIHRIAGIKNCKVRPLHTDEYPTAAARPHYSVLDKTKIKNTYGIEVPYWEDSLTECIALLNK
ncbi:MAG: dTDP-4-dehydrorhamnose reductase [Bacteroidaceae bacterium]|nr:dTDP-4-dehydrorhamnose reductase [Bacteroidaceae bacterium]